MRYNKSEQQPLFIMSPIENPHKRKSLPPPPPPPPRPLPKPKAAPRARYGHAQEAFISNLRKRIDSEPQFFEKNDWSRVSFHQGKHKTTLAGNGKMTSDAFYVKDMAVWVPHLIIKDYIPSCSKCRLKDAVDISNRSWVENPKMLCGANSHRHFDAQCCHCTRCKGSFTGWHEVTLTTDADEVAGVINFRLSKGFAVDDELHSFIVSHSADTTASIHCKHKRMVADQWMCDATLCCRAVLSKRVKGQRPNFVEGANQQMLDRQCFHQQKLSEDQKRARRARDHLRRVTADFNSAKAKYEGDLHFVDVFNAKKNRNATGLPFKGIGKEKCLTLISRSILTARDLLDYDGSDPAILPRWREIVYNHYEGLSMELSRLKQQKDKAEIDFLLDEAFLTEAASAAAAPAVNNNNTNVASLKPPAFSQLTDPIRYNARVVSKSTTDRIKLSDYVRRRKLQLAKMRSIPSRIWKIDFGYKLAPKIKVHTGRGKPFSPYKSIASIQQEDALTTFWKAYPGSEGIDIMATDLKKLNKRNNMIGGHLEVVHVDNCCSVRNKLVKILGDMLVKLDNFHWAKRHDPIMCDLKSEKTIVFRTMMRRAVFFVEDSEYTRAKEALMKRKKTNTATPAEILKEAKATILPPDKLEARVMAVIHCVMRKDLETDINNTRLADGEEKEKRFLKPGPETLNTINNQLEHVRRGCLSDPPADIVPIHRINTKTGKVYTARSTGSVEVAWRYIHHILDTPSIGFTRAEQVINNYLEVSNDKKKTSRLGQEPEVTSRTEQLQALHSMASRCGFSDVDIPVPDPATTFPVDLSNLEENIGFDYCLPCNFNVDVVEEDACDDADETSEDLAGFLRDMDLGDNQEDGDTDPSRLDDVDMEEEDYDPIDTFAGREDIDISIYVPLIVNNESTHASFSEATKGQPWVPFKSPREASSFTDIDNAELAMFDEMKDSYSRTAKLDAGKGYKTFAKAWNLRVSNLYKAKLDGMTDVVVVNRKSYVELQRHYDEVLKQKELEQISKKNDAAMQDMERVFKQTRRDVATTQHQDTQQCQPIRYDTTLGRPQFGVPFALNTNIVANAFHCNQQNNGIVYRAPNTVAVTPMTRNELGASFKARTHCWRCGYQRKTHVRLGISFGDGCHGNCLFDECSKCCERVSDCHPDKRHGPHCTKSVSGNSKVAHLWYPTTETGII